MTPQISLNINSNVFLTTFRPYIQDYSHRYEIYYGGRGSGKTYFCVQKMVLKGLSEKRFILLMNKQTNKIKDGVWKELKDTIDFFKLTPYFDLNRTDFRATCKINGTEIRCLGLDESEKIKGYSKVSDVYLDEATAFTQDDYELIDGTLRSKSYKLPLQLIGSFNPVSKANWVYKYFGFDTNTPPPNTFIHHSTYLDNPKADSAARMEQLKVRNPARYKIEALGEFCSLDKLVFNNWTIQDFNYQDIEGITCIGMDFGFTNDLSTLVASIMDKKNNKLYVFRCWGDTGKTNSDLAQIITTLGFSKSTIIADCSEPKSIEELKRSGIKRIQPSVKGPDSILHGLQRLWQFDIIVHPSCEGLITELENYTWQKDKASGEYINKPIDQFNHYIDALRYSLQSSDKPELKVINKGALGL